jgi:phytoene/squalene synthetase
LKDRVYLPLDLLARHNYTVEELFAHKTTPGFLAAMRESVDFSRGYFEAGLPLIRKVDRRLSLDLELFSRGGMRILDKIERQGYDVLSKRPKISKPERVGMLLGAMLRVAFLKAA